jgi:hypothetical protein
MGSSAAWLFLAGLLMTAVGASALLWWDWGKPGRAAASALGMLAWLVGVALKLAWAVPTNKQFLPWLDGALPGVPGAVLHHGYVGLLTGVFECGLLWLVVRRSRLAAADWGQAMAAGIGKGAAEALVVGLVTCSLAALLFLAGDKVQGDPKARLEAALAGGALIGRPVERALALVMHTFSTVLVVLAVRRGEPKWFWASFLYLSAVDAFASWAVATFGKEAISTHWELWVGLGGFTVVALAGLTSLKPRFEAQVSAPPPAPP